MYIPWRSCEAPRCFTATHDLFFFFPFWFSCGLGGCLHQGFSFAVVSIILRYFTSCLKVGFVMYLGFISGAHCVDSWGPLSQTSFLHSDLRELILMSIRLHHLCSKKLDHRRKEYTNGVYKTTDHSACGQWIPCIPFIYFDSISWWFAQGETLRRRRLINVDRPQWVIHVGLGS